MFDSFLWGVPGLGFGGLWQRFPFLLLSAHVPLFHVVSTFY